MGASQAPLPTSQTSRIGCPRPQSSSLVACSLLLCRRAPSWLLDFGEAFLGSFVQRLLPQGPLQAGSALACTDGQGLALVQKGDCLQWGPALLGALRDPESGHRACPPPFLRVHKAAGLCRCPVVAPPGMRRDLGLLPRDC